MAAFKGLLMLAVVSGLTIIIPTRITLADRDSGCIVQVGKLTKASLIEQFFGAEGLGVIGLDQSDLVDRYSEEVVASMDEFLKTKNDLVQSINLNGQINGLIYKTELKRLTNEASPKEDMRYQALLEALDLMVPNFSEEPVYELAKSSLRAFHKEQPELAAELFERLLSSLEGESPQLLTIDLVRHLRHYYRHWIPLGRLASYLNSLPLE